MKIQFSQMACAILGIALFASISEAGTKSWDGGAATDSWHDAANWSPDGVPGSKDEVTISGAASPVVYSTGSSTIASLNVSSSTLFTMSGGSLDVIGAFDIISTDFDYFGGEIIGTPVLRTVAVFVGPGVIDPAVLVTNGACDLLGNESASTEIWVRGQSGAGSANLTIPASITNAGAIRLESINTNWNSDLTIASGQTLTNLGTIESRLGTGGARRILGDGTLNNSGAIFVETGIDLVMSDALGVFNQNAGAVTADGPFIVRAGTLNHNGGSLTGEVWADDATVNVEATVVAPSTIIATGFSTLIKNLSAATEIWIRGQSGTNAAQLNVPLSATNAGTIRLESAITNWNSDLVIGVGQTLTNTGTIEARLGTGGSRTITGDATLHNLGTITTDTPFTLSPTNFIHDGGSIEGEVWLQNSSIDITSGPSIPSTITVIGTGCSLVANDAASVEVWVRGKSGSNQSRLSIPASTSNAGALRLESSNTNWESGLSLGSGQTLTNLGTIDVRLGTGGARTVLGDGTIDNQGNVLVEAGSEMVMSDAAGMLLQNAGMIDAQGRLTVLNGTLVHAGGALVGDIRVDDGTLDVLASADIAGLISATGNTQLLGNNSAATEVWVRGNSIAQHANVSLPNTATNAGTIRMESESTTWSSNLVLGSGQTLTNLGTIESRIGSTGSRLISGDGNIINEGTILVELGTELRMTDALATFTHNNGTIIGDGPFIVSQSSFTMTGGSLVGEVWADDAMIDVQSTVTEPGTLSATGLTQLIGNDSSVIEVWVRGQAATGSAIMDVPADASNAGTIRMESQNSTWSSDVTIGAGQTLTNLGTIDCRLGSGGSRTISGDATLHNSGTLTTDTTLVVQPSNYVHAGGEWIGEVWALGTTIDVESTATTPTTINVIGPGCTLIENESAVTELWVRGKGGLGGSAILNTAPLAVNAGRIRLESQDSSWTSAIAIPESEVLTVLEGGRIESKLGTGGARTITGDIVNGGTLDAGYPASIVLNGNYTQTTTGVFRTEFAGEPVGAHTFLDVNGDAHLDGAITIARVDGFAPAPGTNIDVMTANLITGAFNETLSCDPITVSHDGIDVTVTFGAVTGILGDLTGDGVVGINDLLLLLGGWGPCPKGGPIDCCPGDLNEDGTIDVLDLLLMLGNWS